MGYFIIILIEGTDLIILRCDQLWKSSHHTKVKIILERRLQYLSNLQIIYKEVLSEIHNSSPGSPCKNSVTQVAAIWNQGTSLGRCLMSFCPPPSTPADATFSCNKTSNALACPDSIAPLSSGWLARCKLSLQ